jgi:hypothetical protein
MTHSDSPTGVSDVFMLIVDEEWVTVTVVAAAVIEEGISETSVLDGSRKSIADMAVVARLTVVWMSQSGEAGRLFGQLVFGKAPGLARWRR